MLLSVPGRLVPTLLDHLRPKLSAAAHATLVRYQVPPPKKNRPGHGRRTGPDLARTRLGCTRAC